MTNKQVSKENSVPPFEMYFPSVGAMTAEQLSFYSQLSTRLSRGEAPNVDGQISYLFTFAYAVLDKWHATGMEQLAEDLMDLGERYANEEKFSRYCKHWAHDCLLTIGEHERFLEVTEPLVPFAGSTHKSNVRLNIQFESGLDSPAADLSIIANARPTKFTRENFAPFRDVLSTTFEEIARTEGPWLNRILDSDPKRRQHHHYLFAGAPLQEKPYLKQYAFYTPYEFLEIIRSAVRSAENELRQKMGVPGVGEGWVSETTLFKKIAQTFSETEVIHHGSPPWLGRQHLDIWLPRWKIGVEYHGLQHFQPVEFFGGEAGHAATRERDARKASLCKKHGVRLIVTTEEETAEQVIDQIRRLRRAGPRHPQ